MAVQWLYNGCIYVCCVVGRHGQVSTLSHVGGVAPALLPILYSTPAGGSPLSYLLLLANLQLVKEAQN